MTELRSKELIKAGHAFAETLDADMPLTEIAKLVSALATRLDVELARNREVQKQSDAVLAESTARGVIVDRIVGQLSCAGYHGMQNSNNPAESLLFDALRVMAPGTTSTILESLHANQRRYDFLRQFFDVDMWDADDYQCIRGLCFDEPKFDRLTIGLPHDMSVDDAIDEHLMRSTANAIKDRP